jgi:hypothetical protein
MKKLWIGIASAVFALALAGMGCGGGDEAAEGDTSGGEMPATDAPAMDAPATDMPATDAPTDDTTAGTSGGETPQ